MFVEFASFAIPRTDHKVLFAERAASKSDPLFGRLVCEILGRNASALINRWIVIDRSANDSRLSSTRVGWGIRRVQSAPTTVKL